jgi:major membrane immunogen (membrane-anchored lipoprotein)
MSAATVAEPRQALQALADQLRSEDTPIAVHVVDPAATP